MIAIGVTNAEALNEAGKAGMLAGVGGTSGTSSSSSTRSRSRSPIGENKHLSSLTTTAEEVEEDEFDDDDDDEEDEEEDEAGLEIDPRSLPRERATWWTCWIGCTLEALDISYADNTIGLGLGTNVPSLSLICRVKRLHGKYRVLAAAIVPTNTF